MANQIENQGSAKVIGGGQLGKQADKTGHAPKPKPVTEGVVGATSPEHVGMNTASDSHRGPVSA
jgi:hypothetical protein